MTRTGTGSPSSARSISGLGWLFAALIALAVLGAWLPDLNLPLGDSDDGRLLARFALAARNFWELGPVESGFGARIDPYIREEFGVQPGMSPPPQAITYAHHPPLQVFITIFSVGIMGDSPAALRIVGFLLGAGTVLFMAAMARAAGLAWGPILVGLGGLASTGFFFVYGRIGVGFSLIAATIALVAYLRRVPDPPVWMLIGAAILTFLTAMQSWIAIAALVLALAWMYAARGRSPGFYYLAAGALAGIAVTGVWLGINTPVSEFVSQVETTVGSRFTLGEFLSRQWGFARELTPIWFQIVAPLALVAGLVDRRTRVPVAITLAVAAALTFGIRQSAWVHRLWNFPWMAPISLGLMAGADLVRRHFSVRTAALTGGVAGVIALLTFVGLFAGPTRDTYLLDPADAGTVLAEAMTPEGTMWVTPGIPAPRWVSYYLDAPVWTIEEAYAGLVRPGDVVLTRTDRRRAWIQLPEEPRLEQGRYLLFDGADWSNSA